MEEIISSIVEGWFLTEPLLFSVWCKHTLTENRKMLVPMRTGRMRIEYNPDIISHWTKETIEERLRFEVIRILLCHPYQRQPYQAKKVVLGIASDITIVSCYHGQSTIVIPKGLHVKQGLCFEEYYAIVEDYLRKRECYSFSLPYDLEGVLDDGGGGFSDGAESRGGNAGDETLDSQQLQHLLDDEKEIAELWEEDELSAELIKETIKIAQRNKQWGSISGVLKDEIEAATTVHIDYRTILSCFRASILCSKRHRTRMIPSRRYGFQFMGSRRDFATRFLVAIDVSGSVNDKQVSQALSIVNRFFKYGVETIDVVLFDVGLRGDVLTMNKAQKTIKISGRGGTSFQAPIDYFWKNKYDGLIMITDGYAPEPKTPGSIYGNILWMIYNDELFRRKKTTELDSSIRWIASFPKSKYTILPPV